MTQGPNNGGRCGNVIETVTANESANGIGSVTTVTTVTVATVIATVSANAVVTTMGHGVVVDGKIANVPETMTGNVVVEVMPVLLIRLEKSYDVEAADVTRTAGGSDVSEMRHPTWHKAITATNMKVVYDHHRPWAEHPRRHLLSREALRKNDDLAVGETAIVSATEIEHGIEITIARVAAAVVAAAAAVTASVDEQETKEEDMAMEEVGEECAWAVRANGLDGGCKINGMFQLTCVSFLVFHLILSTTLLLCSKLSLLLLMHDWDGVWAGLRLFFR